MNSFRNINRLFGDFFSQVQTPRLAMDEQNIRNKISQIFNLMENFDLETAKLASVQAELCDVKKIVSVLEQENTLLHVELNTLKDEMDTIKTENSILHVELNTLKEEMDAIKTENYILKGETLELKSNVDSLRNDVQSLKSLFKSKVGHCSSEPASSNETGDTENGGSKEPVGNIETEVPLAGLKISDEKEDPPNVSRKPKQQRKREQAEIFRNWRRTMERRKTPEDLWVSGLLKITMELWEDTDSYMDEEQILDFIRRNAGQMTPYILTEAIANKFFCTLLKMCSVRKVSKPKFEEIMFCFDNHGSQGYRITQSIIQIFINMYKP